MKGVRLLAMLILGSLLGNCVLRDCPESQVDTGCLDCDIDNNCTDCVIGSYLEQGFCHGCMEGCVDCSDADTCLQCQDGYTTGTICTKCDSRCVGCLQDPSKCTGCIYPYTLESDRSCQYKYMWLLIALGASVVVIAILILVLAIKICGMNGSPTKYDKVLDDEITNTKTVVSHMNDIGVTERNDMSGIEESYSKKPMAKMSTNRREQEVVYNQNLDDSVNEEEEIIKSMNERNLK